jgi:hypothetical protein
VDEHVERALADHVRLAATARLQFGTEALPSSVKATKPVSQERIIVNIILNLLSAFRE